MDPRGVCNFFDLYSLLRTGPLSDDLNEREEKFPRYFVAVSLAEGETIRRVIHMRHPILNQCAVALRSLEGGIIDQSPLFWGEPKGKHAALCIESLKFINCEMYYKDDELEILEEALSGAPLDMRKVYYCCCFTDVLRNSSWIVCD